jgi:hypothetical protein
MSYPRRAWEPEALAWLQEHAPQMRFSKLFECYQEVAHQNGWRPRTFSALRIKLSGLGLGSSHAVICLETGHVYPTPKKAAKAVGRKTETLRGAIRTGGTCAGYRWAYLDDLEDQRHA